MDFERAMLFLHKARQIGREKQTLVSVAIVDAAGHPVLVARGKPEAWHGPYMATGKARLSAAFRKPTGVLVKLWEDRPLYANSLNDVIPGGVTLNPGGYPIFDQGVCIGAIGVGGNKPSIDDEIARLTIEAMGAGPPADVKP